MAIERLIDTLIHSKPELYLSTHPDTLITTGDLISQVRFFLISCKVDSLSPKTIKGYTQILHSFLMFCRERDIGKAQDITTDDIRSYILTLQERMKPVSVADYYRTVKRFLNWLLAEKVLKENPMSRIRPPRIPKQVIQPFTADHIKRMLVVCGNNFAGCRDLAIVLTFLDTGMRLGADISLFSRESTDVIDWIRTEGETVWNADNHGVIQTSGIELKTRAQLSQNWSGSISAMFLDQTVKQRKGIESKYALHPPSVVVSGNIAGDLPAEIVGSLKIRYEDILHGESRIPVSVSCSKTFGTVAAILSVSNLFNERYDEIPGLRAPGRWINLRLEYNR